MPRKPDYTVLFCKVDENIEPNIDSTYESDEITLQITEERDSLIVGRYEYESNPIFGSSTQAEGFVIFDTRTNLTAVTTLGDRLKGTSIFETLENSLNVNFEMPDVNPEDQYDIYHQYGPSSLNGYTISFKSKTKSFGPISQIGKTVDPEDKAKEIAQYSDKQISRTMVNDIARDAMDDKMYIWSANLDISGFRIAYSDPLRFTRVSDEFVDELGFEQLFEIARNAID